MRQQQQQIQRAQAEQLARAESLALQAQAEQAEQMEALRQQNEQLRAAMARQYQQLHTEQIALKSKLAKPSPAEGERRCDSALSESVLRTPYLDPTYEAPPRAQLPVPAPEVEAALARLRLPGAATAAVAGAIGGPMIGGDERGWSPLVHPTYGAQEGQGYAQPGVGLPAPPRPPAAPRLEDDMNLSLRGPEDLRSSLRGASELLYPSEETLRRSLAAESAEKEALRSQATASWLGLQPTLGFSEGGRKHALPAVPEADELTRSLAAADALDDARLHYDEGARAGRRAIGGGGGGGGAGRSRPDSREGSRPPSAGPFSGRPTSAPELPGTPGLDTLVRRAEERLRQLQLAEGSPESTHRVAFAAAPNFADIHDYDHGGGGGGGNAHAHGGGGGNGGGGGSSKAHESYHSLRGSMHAESAFVPLADETDGVPEWLRSDGTPPSYSNGRLEVVTGRRAEMDSRDSSRSVAESTGTALERHAVDQELRAAEYAARLHALHHGDASVDVTVARPRSQGGYGVGRGEIPGSGRGDAPSREMTDLGPMGLPKDRPYTEWSHGATPSGTLGNSGERTVEERTAWLRQLEAQLGMEGILLASPGAPPSPNSGSALPRPPSASARPSSASMGTGMAASAEARLKRLERLEAGIQEKEELDHLLSNYLQQK
jgi:hypothetical protein